MTRCAVVVSALLFVYATCTALALVARLDSYVSIERKTFTTCQTISLYPAGWMAKAVKTMRRDVQYIKEIIYLPNTIPPLLAADSAAHCLDDDHVVSRLVDQGFVVHCLVDLKPSSRLSQDFIAALREVLKWRAEKTAARSLCLVANELSCTHLLSYLAEIALPMTSRRVDIGAVVLIDPAPLLLGRSQGCESVLSAHYCGYLVSDAIPRSAVAARVQARLIGERFRGLTTTGRSAEKVVDSFGRRVRLAGLELHGLLLALQGRGAGAWAGAGAGAGAEAGAAGYLALGTDAWLGEAGKAEASAAAAEAMPPVITQSVGAGQHQGQQQQQQPVDIEAADDTWRSELRQSDEAENYVRDPFMRQWQQRERLHQMKYNIPPRQPPLDASRPSEPLTAAAVVGPCVSLQQSRDVGHALRNRILVVNTFKNDGGSEGRAEEDIVGVSVSPAGGLGMGSEFGLRLGLDVEEWSLRNCKEVSAMCDAGAVLSFDDAFDAEEEEGEGEGEERGGGSQLTALLSGAEEGEGVWHAAARRKHALLGTAVSDWLGMLSHCGYL